MCHLMKRENKKLIGTQKVLKAQNINFTIMQPHDKCIKNLRALRLTAGAASRAPSAVENATCFRPLCFINLGPNCKYKCTLMESILESGKIQN